jgi:alpha-glucosidase
LIADQEKDLITNQLVYLLAKPAADGDYSWIKPGMATLDWWGRRNLFGVDFVGGVNMETFKYFIDFNSKLGIPYFVFDDGWSDRCDIYKTNKNLNLREIFDYADKKNVDIILWVQAHVLENDVKGILDYFAELGAKGIKVDFFNRDDQEMVNLFHEIAKEAMDRKIIVDFHGICKPTGLIRTYPNVLTSEGLIEFEQNGVSDNANPVLHNMLPFIRMATGPMDYLPGTVNNAQRKEFYQNMDRPVGLGTRAHSMALTVVFESPITMLPDSPSDYYKEEECTKFISDVPTVWDETRVIDAKVGDYVIIARRNGNDWYLAAITDWASRNFNIKLDFLDDQIIYNCELFADGSNSTSRAIDYKRKETIVKIDDTINIKMAQGGGWIAKISKKQP